MYRTKKNFYKTKYTDNVENMVCKVLVKSTKDDRSHFYVMLRYKKKVKLFTSI